MFSWRCALPTGTQTAARMFRAWTAFVWPPVILSADDGRNLPAHAVGSIVRPVRSAGAGRLRVSETEFFDARPRGFRAL